MTILLYIGSFTVALVFLFICIVVHEELQINKPTRAIISKIESGEFLVLENGHSFIVKTQYDKTEFRYYSEINEWSAFGEFSWMNDTEVKRAGNAAKAIAENRMTKYHEACNIEKQARDERSRAESAKRYEEKQ